MRALLVPALVLALVPRGAHADNPVAESRSETKIPIAIGVNLPVRWDGGQSVAGSVYVGLTRRLAIRANIASYDYHGSLGEDLALGFTEAEDPTWGRLFDVGVGLTHYSRKLWDGAMVEVGVLRRTRDLKSDMDFAAVEIVNTQTTTYAAHALFGWSWLISGHLFIAAAIGVSDGWERGDEQTAKVYGDMTTNHSVSRNDYSAEGYLRFGGAFDL